jgi:hypothetical protein
MKITAVQRNADRYSGRHKHRYYRKLRRFNLFTFIELPINPEEKGDQS